jgi:hypothetical protein
MAVEFATALLGAGHGLWVPNVLFEAVRCEPARRCSTRLLAWLTARSLLRIGTQQSVVSRVISS